MAEGFDSTSPQGFLMYSTSAVAGTAISLKDSSGQEVLSAEIPCSFSSIVLSAPELSVGNVCTLTVGDVQEQVTIDNTSASGFALAGMFGGGIRGGRDYNGMMSGQEAAKENPENSAVQAAVPDGTGAPPETDVSDSESWMDQRGGWADGETQLSPGRGQPQEGEGRFQQQDWEQMSSGGAAAVSNLSSETVVLVGISVLTLLLGLLIAVKVRH